jgi:hypothetical protein
MEGAYASLNVMIPVGLIMDLNPLLADPGLPLNPLFV